MDGADDSLPPEIFELCALLHKHSLLEVHKHSLLELHKHSLLELHKYSLLELHLKPSPFCRHEPHPVSCYLRGSSTSIKNSIAMNLLSLDLDVVHVIVSEIQPTDALRLSLTCRAAHNVAYPRFLSEVVLGHPWRRTGPDRLVQFCTSMLADASLRAFHLRELTIFKTAFQQKRDSSARSILDSTAMSFLSEVLKYAVNLRCICIHDTEELLETMPQFRWTLAALPNLQEVRFLHCGTLTLDVLSAFSSHPRRLELDLSELASDIDSPPDHAPDAMHGLMQDLVSLRLSRPAGLLSMIRPDPAWSSIQHLEIWGDVDSLSALAEAMPNLRRLHLVCSYVEDVLTPAHWAHLDYVCASSPIPLNAPVRRLELMYDLDVLLDSTPYAVWVPGTLALLQRTDPVVLACCPNMQILRCIASTARSVRFLQILFHQPVHPDTAGVDDVEMWLRVHIPMLTAIPLVALTFARSLSTSIREHELEKLARLVAAEVPSLKYVGLNLGVPNASQRQWTECEYKWWGVSRATSEEGVEVEMLVDSEGAAAHQRLLELERA